MNKSKPTKVPAMKQDQPFEDWKKELEIWQETNTTLGVDPKIQAGSLFESLDGVPRQTVLSELTVRQITAVDGVQNILTTLNFFYSGNETQNAFNVIDMLLNYKRPVDLSIEKFIIAFQLIINKVKVSGTILSERLLGYALLKSANLSNDKENMVKATCDELTYKKVKAQIEKIGVGDTVSGNQSKFLTGSGSSNAAVKVEQCFCGKTTCAVYQNNGSADGSSDEDANGDNIFYSGQRNRLNNFSGNKRPQMNPVDRFGHVRSCAFCKCHYHWLAECPYAPHSIKNEVANKARYKSVPKTL